MTKLYIGLFLVGFDIVSLFGLYFFYKLWKEQKKENERLNGQIETLNKLIETLRKFEKIKTESVENAKKIKSEARKGSDLDKFNNSISVLSDNKD